MIAAVTASDPTRYVLFVCNHNAGRPVAIRVLYPDVTPAEAADVVLPHQQTRADGMQAVVH
jgi:hypothetical protein